MDTVPSDLAFITPGLDRINLFNLDRIFTWSGQLQRSRTSGRGDCTLSDYAKWCYLIAKLDIPRKENRYI